MAHTMSKSRKEPILYLNVMVVGGTGSGKTGFVRTISERVKGNCVPGSFRESSPCVLQGPIQPTQELYSVSMLFKPPSNQRTTDFTIIDTQGLVRGFALGHQLVFLTKYIEHQMERSLIEESKVKRDPKAHDSRIHACLYFIDAQTCDGPSEMDMYAIKVLSTRTNLIPVVGKVDTLSARQLSQLKTNFRKSVFDIHKIPLYGLLSLDDDDGYSRDDDDYEPDYTPPPLPPTDIQQQQIPCDMDDSTTLDILIGMLKEMGKREINDDVLAMIDYLENLPLSVIGYEEDTTTGRPLAKDKTGKTILGRTYPWAIVNCCDPTHCDLERLVDLLFFTHSDMLRLDTVERFYEQYRIDQLLSQRVDEMVDVKSKSSGQHSTL